MKQYVTAEEFRDTCCPECPAVTGYCADMQDLSDPKNVHWMYACPKYFNMNLQRYKELSHVAKNC